MRGGRVERVTELERSDLCDELLSELVVDVLVDEDSVGADARLAGQSELGRDESVDGLWDVGVGKDGEDGISTKLERAPGRECKGWSVTICQGRQDSAWYILLERARGLLHEKRTDGRASGERDLSDVGVGRHLVTDVDRVLVGRENVDDTLGEAGLLDEGSEGEGRKGSLRGSLDDGGATGSERRTKLSRL